MPPSSGRGLAPSSSEWERQPLVWIADQPQGGGHEDVPDLHEEEFTVFSISNGVDTQDPDYGQGRRKGGWWGSRRRVQSGSPALERVLYFMGGLWDRYGVRTAWRVLCVGLAIFLIMSLFRSRGDVAGNGVESVACAGEDCERMEGVAAPGPSPTDVSMSRDSGSGVGAPGPAPVVKVTEGVERKSVVLVSVDGEKTWKRPDAIVAKDGSGDYLTVQEAISASPEKALTAQEGHIIFVKGGVYREQVVVNSRQWYLTLIGELGKTIITENKTAGDLKPAPGTPLGELMRTAYHPEGDNRTRPVSEPGVKRDPELLGTVFASTFNIVGQGFTAYGITFENSAGLPRPELAQAMAPAIHVDNFLGPPYSGSAFYHCTFLGYQDTLYAHSGRQYYEYCVIEGSMDIIFGMARAQFVQCAITVRLKKPHKGAISAQGRASEDEFSGFVFIHGKVRSWGGLSVLGRAWRPYATVLFSQVNLASVLQRKGWSDLGDPLNRRTVHFMEHENHGPGASRQGRVKWSRNITWEEAAPYLSPDYINASLWLRPVPTFRLSS